MIIYSKITIFLKTLLFSFLMGNCIYGLFFHISIDENSKSLHLIIFIIGQIIILTLSFVSFCIECFKYYNIKFNNIDDYLSKITKEKTYGFHSLYGTFNVFHAFFSIFICIFSIVSSIKLIPLLIKTYCTRFNKFCYVNDYYLIYIFALLSYYLFVCLVNFTILFFNKNTTLLKTINKNYLIKIHMYIVDMSNIKFNQRISHNDIFAHIDQYDDTESLYDTDLEDPLLK